VGTILIRFRVIRIERRFKNKCYISGKSEAKLSLSPKTLSRLQETRSIVEDIVEKGYVRYGINTGFGLLSKVVIENEKLVDLQYNIVRFD
jgi:histidine ammonia-lyase